MCCICLYLMLLPKAYKDAVSSPMTLRFAPLMRGRIFSPSYYLLTTQYLCTLKWINHPLQGSVLGYLIDTYSRYCGWAMCHMHQSSRHLDQDHLINLDH